MDMAGSHGENWPHLEHNCTYGLSCKEDSTLKRDSFDLGWLGFVTIDVPFAKKNQRPLNIYSSGVDLLADYDISAVIDGVCPFAYPKR